MLLVNAQLTKKVVGEALGFYIPQSVVNKDSQVMDVDIVLNEIFSDGDILFVEYSTGPTAYQTRWSGRPASPPFQWGESGEIIPPHDVWLDHVDLNFEGTRNIAAKPDELEMTKQILKMNAGPLQAVFLFYECHGEKSCDLVGRMNLMQFKNLMSVARVTSSQFPPERLDEIFTLIATSQLSLDRKMDALGASTFDVIDFFTSLPFVAHSQAAALDEGGNMAAITPLSQKLESLVESYFAQNVYPEISKRIEKVSLNALTQGSKLLLQKGRKLTEQTLDTCQLKRLKAKEVRVALKYLCTHLQKWGLLGRELSFQEVAWLAMYAKHNSSDIEGFMLQPEPIDFNYREFEKFLLGCAYHMHVMKKRQEPFEEFLGNTLDQIFQKAGVLPDAAEIGE